MVVLLEHDEGVLDETDQGERPEDEAEDAEEVVLPRVRQRDGREHVQRWRAEVAVHDTQRLVAQQRDLQ